MAPEPDETMSPAPDPLRVGYARCSTDEQDLSVQRHWLESRGVPSERIYLDHGRSGRQLERPGLDQALAAVRPGDRLVVHKLDRLGRSLRDLLAIAEDLERRGVQLAIGDSVYDPADPFGRLFFHILGSVAEFEAALIRRNTREGMARAKAAGRLRGSKPKLSPRQQRHLRETWDKGEHSVSELSAIFKVSRATIYREIRRQPVPLPKQQSGGK